MHSAQCGIIISLHKSVKKSDFCWTLRGQQSTRNHPIFKKQRHVILGSNLPIPTFSIESYTIQYWTLHN